MQRRVAVAVMILAVAASGWAAPQQPETAVQAKESKPEKGVEAKDETSRAGEKSEQEPRRSWHFSTWKVGGRLNYQLLHMREATSGMDPMSSTRGMSMAAELESTATISNGSRDLLDLAVQYPYYTQMRGVDGRGEDMHFFNAYGVFKLGLGKPSIRFGQFVVPFGNLPYYETHTLPLQSLYPQSLGFRIQRGVSFDGFVRAYDYSVAAMGADGTREVVGRVARRFDLPNGIFTVGLSALYGQHVQRFSTLLDPLMDDALPGMPLSQSVDSAHKIRIALDAEYGMGRDLLRAELVTGRDIHVSTANTDGLVDGQFLQWNRALFSDKNELMFQLARWEQSAGTRLGLGASYGRKLREYFTARVSVERSLGRTPDMRRNETNFTLQLICDVPKLLGR